MKSMVLFRALFFHLFKDLDKLSEEDKKFVIERVDKLNAMGLVQVYNALGVLEAK